MKLSGDCRRVLTVAITVGLSVTVVSCKDAAPASSTVPRLTVRLSTGPSIGTLRNTGRSLEHEFSRLPEGPIIQTLLSTGAVENVVAVQDGRADLGLTYADIAYDAFAGRLEDRPEKFDHLAGVALMQVAPLHVVISSKSRFRSIAELNGGRIALTGLSDSGSRITSLRVLKALVGPLSGVTIVPIVSSRAFDGLETGQIDAVMQVGLDPLTWLGPALEKGSRLLPLSTMEVDHLNEAYPFFRPTVIRQSLYTSLKSSVPTIGVDTLLVCGKALNEQLVYDVTKALFQVLPALSFPDGAAFIDVEQAAATPIPLHAGASRFYRERQLSR